MQYRNSVIALQVVFLASICTWFVVREGSELSRYFNQNKRLPSTVVQRHIEVDIFIMVMSRVSKPERQAVIRETWAAHLPSNIVLRFFVGNDGILRDEQDDSDIVVLQNYVDNYRDLNNKRIHAMKWMLGRYKPKYVFKTDDDVFVNIPLLNHKLYNGSWPRSLFYLGFIMDPMAIIRDIEHPNSEPYIPINMRHYPPYHSGCGYIMSIDVVRFLANPGLQPLQLTNDDTSIGLALAYSNVTIQHEPSIYIHPIHGCLPSKDVMLAHYVPASTIRMFHRNATLGLDLCN